MLELGFYCGLSILYPYAPVYCPQESCIGDCRGVYLYQSKSAPLSSHRKWCEGVDPNSKDLLNNWYQWAPRIMSPDREKYLGARICFWEDRGQPHNLNDLERE